ncbi:antitoxin VapB family protein [Halomarina halobia]|uniref:Antitoxin VapB family protein n=1 Tax=Halomarina halobia TaxID=3033386 RepID=A0ABD6AFG9_9EURY|nr:antitoxin VapB family protein [Halomarina sp. PSR21]
MATKSLTIREDAYERLRALKRDDESFSDLVDRLTAEKNADWRTHIGFAEREGLAEEYDAVMRRRREEMETTDSLFGDVLEPLGREGADDERVTDDEPEIDDA